MLLLFALDSRRAQASQKLSLFTQPKNTTAHKRPFFPILNEDNSSDITASSQLHRGLSCPRHLIHTCHRGYLLLMWKVKDMENKSKIANELKMENTPWNQPFQLQYARQGPNNTTIRIAGINMYPNDMWDDNTWQKGWTLDCGQTLVVAGAATLVVEIDSSDTSMNHQAINVVLVFGLRWHDVNTEAPWCFLYTIQPEDIESSEVIEALTEHAKHRAQTHPALSYSDGLFLWNEFPYCRRRLVLWASVEKWTTGCNHEDYYRVSIRLGIE